MFLTLISVLISSICLYSLTKHYLSLQFIKNQQKIIKNEESSQKLNTIFYELLETKNGYITVLDFVIKSGLDFLIVTNFMDQKVYHFGGKSVLSVDGYLQAWKFDYLTKNELLELSAKN